MAEGSNFPPPKGMADQIIAKAIPLLDADVWDNIDDDYITIRTVAFDRKDASIVISTDGADVFRYGAPSPAYREAFREACGRAIERERERRLRPLDRAISDDSHGRRQIRRRLAMAGVAVVILGLSAVGVTSCVNDWNAKEAVERARDGEVNKYGFRRGAITSRKVWPDECAGSGFQTGNDYGSGREFKSIYECKRYWEGWERDGTMWVDWKELTP
jgi:hypothetical protein